MILKKIKAFTLAEVLITLTIIGVVAAMVIPAIVSSAQNKELIEASKKEYSVVNQALTLYKADNGGSISDMFPPDKDSNYSLDQLSPYLKIGKKCNTSQVCWNENTKYLNQLGDKDGNFSLGGWNLGYHTASAILADGSRITINNNGANIGQAQQCTQFNADGSMQVDGGGNPVTYTCYFNNYAFVYIDVNGEKGPNRFGQDTWELRLYDNKINGCGWASYYGCLESILKTDALVQPKS